MVSLAGQRISELRDPPTSSFSVKDNSRLVLDYHSLDPHDSHTLSHWVSQMSMNHTAPTTRSSNITERVSVPSSEHVAEIVGRQGCKIKALRDKTGTYIKTPVRGDEPVFIVTGRPEDVSTARKEILAAAEHFTQIRASRSRGGNASGSQYSMPLSYGGLAAPSRPPDNDITIKVRVPYRVVGLVVGPKGSTIKRIQQTTGTFIVTPSRDREPCFEVTGSAENVEQAKDEIENYIAMRTRNSEEEDVEGGRRSPNSHHHMRSGRTSDGMSGRLNSVVSPLSLLNDSESPFEPSNLANAVDQLATHNLSYLAFQQYGVTGHPDLPNTLGPLQQAQQQHQQQQALRSLSQGYPRERSLSRASSAHSNQSQNLISMHSDVPHRPVGLTVSDPTSEIGRVRRIHHSLLPESRDAKSASSIFGGGNYGAVGTSPTTPSTTGSGNAFNISLSTPSASSISPFETPESHCTNSSSDEPGISPRSRESKTCYLCRVEHAKETALVPCGHVYCHACAVKAYSDNNRMCPRMGCNCRVEDILRIRVSQD
eukprot:scpid41089/ scgid20896/ RNA-binding protein MEX3B; RING finger and KH domain-containing protein 3